MMLMLKLIKMIIMIIMVIVKIMIMMGKHGCIISNITGGENKSSLK